MLSIRNLSKKYQDKIVLDNVSFDFEDTSLYFVVGPNGSGKTTLLNSISGFIKNDSGSILYNNEVISSYDEEKMESFRRDHLLYICQDKLLFNSLSVEDNLDLSLYLFDKAIDNQNREILDSFDIKDINYNDKVNTLSLGQKQKVLLIKSMISTSSIVLADEPTENLDLESKYFISKYLYDMSKKHLVIIVTHDRDLINSYPCHTLTLKNGKIQSVEKTDHLLTEDSNLLVDGQSADSKNIFFVLQKAINTEKRTVEVKYDGEKKHSTEEGTFQSCVLHKKKKQLFRYFPIINKGKQTIVGLLYLVSLFIILAMSTFLLFSPKKIARNYYRENKIDLCIPYYQAEKTNSIDDYFFQIMVGEKIMGLLSQNNYNYYKCFKNQNITYEFNGIDSLLSTNFIVYNKNPDLIYGRLPVSDSEIIISKEMYHQLFKNYQYTLPKEIKIQTDTIYTIVGICSISSMKLDDYSETVRRNYSDNYFNSIFFNESSFPGFQGIVYTYLPVSSKKISVFENTSLQNNEINLSSFLMKKEEKSIGDNILFSDTLDDTYQNGYDDAPSLSHFYSEGAVIKGETENQFQIEVSSEVYLKMKKQYDEYYSYDYLIVPISSSYDVSKLQKIGLSFFEENVAKINSYSNTIHQISYVLYIILFVSTILFVLSVAIGSLVLFGDNEKNIGYFRAMGFSRRIIEKAVQEKSMFFHLMFTSISLVFFFIFSWVINIYFRSTTGLAVNFYYPKWWIIIALVILSFIISYVLTSRGIRKIYNRDIQSNINKNN